MGGYSRAHEVLNEYEEDGLYNGHQDIEEEEEYGEAEAEEVEVEDPTPKKEVLEYLELRQKFKEEARKKLAKESGRSCDLQDKRKLQLDNFGSFFGPSRPVIADRVIQECKSFLKNQQEAAKVSSSRKDVKKGNVSSALQNGMSVQCPLNPVKTKVQKLKDTRDYSFLLSDEADVPGTANDHPGLSNSDGGLAQVPSKSKECGHSGNQLQYSSEEKRQGTVNSHIPPGLNSPCQKPPSSIRPDSKRSDRLLEHKKQLPVGSLGSAPGRPALPELLLSKKASQFVEKKVSSNIERKVAVTSTERKAPVASKEKKPPIIVSKGLISRGQQAPLVKSQIVGLRHQSDGRRIQDSSKFKILARETPSLKPQIKVPKQVSSQVGRGDDLYRSKPQLMPKPKPKLARRLSDEEDDEGLQAIAEIRKMFRYNPNRYAGDDGDLSDMEADFRTIQREELRSSKIAREEDERELKLIQEEEEREKQRKLAKKRKKGQR